MAKSKKVISLLSVTKALKADHARNVVSNQLLKIDGLGQKMCFINGRPFGGTSGLSIGHASPEAASGGAIGLVRDGDIINIDIPNRAAIRN